MKSGKNDKARTRRVRLFVNTPLAAGGKTGLSEAQAHYLGKVMRVKLGDSILIFNGRDGEWRAKLITLQRSKGILLIVERTRPQSCATGPMLLFAPLKAARNAFLIEKLVELGVGALQPVTTAYSQTHRINLQRFRLQAIEASEQCGRLTVPPVHRLVPLQQLLTDWTKERPILFCDETGGQAAFAAISSAAAARPDAVRIILIGPEGGFSPQEREYVRSRVGTISMSLGPRILRGETAAITALSLWQAAIGDFRSDVSNITS